MRKAVTVREVDADVWRKIRVESTLIGMDAADMLEVLFVNWECTHPDDKMDSIKAVRHKETKS